MNVLPAPAGRPLGLPRLTGWQLFVFALVVALGSEYWDKNPLHLPNGMAIPWPRFLLAMAITPLAIGAGVWRWSAVFAVPR